MPWFRTAPADPTEARHALTAEDVRRAVADALAPGNFVVSSPAGLRFEGPILEEIPWELFRGRLLPPNQTRQQEHFQSWNIYHAAAGDEPEGPLLSVKLDATRRVLHVTRGLACLVWEGYDAGGGVILSRQCRRWLAELVGTVRFDNLAGVPELADELACMLFEAFTGTSRLPLTSSESPLPDFSLGQTHYLPVGRWGGARSPGELLRAPVGPEAAWPEVVKAAEFLIRATPTENAVTVAGWLRMTAATRGADAFGILRDVFNDAALTPYTDFVPKALAVAAELAPHSPAAHADFLGALIRQVVRHLTAYDLITFHHRGANYPDALLLDAALRELLAIAEREPSLFLNEESGSRADNTVRRLRRRALRQGLFLRRFYEGLPVPDAPTSPGENARLLPPPFELVPDDQIADPSKRRRRLYDGAPTESLLTAVGRRLLAAALDDLADERELRELGTALYIDRPLGSGRGAGEPDQTPLLSYVAFSRSIATKRLADLVDAGWLSAGAAGEGQSLLVSLPTSGVPARAWNGVRGSAAVSVEDALRVSEDFVFLRTTPTSLRRFFALFDLERQDARVWARIVARDTDGAAPAGSLALFDVAANRRLTLAPNQADGWITRAGVEYPVAGLRVTGVWSEEGKSEQIPADVRVPVRDGCRPWSDR